MPILNNMIENGMFSDYVNEIVRLNEKEKWWDLYLHKTTFEEISFDDFLEAHRAKPQVPFDVEATIIHSFNILDNFKPY